MTRADFPAYVTERDKLESCLAVASARLNSIPGIGSGPMGLTPDHVKRSLEYRLARMAYDSAFAQLRALNGANVKRFARELRAERDARRQARLEALAG